MRTIIDIFYDFLDTVKYGKYKETFRVDMERNRDGFVITVVETADNHTIFEGSGTDLETALLDCLKHIDKETLDAYGYKANLAMIAPFKQERL